jgi:hypothetical protein
LLPSVETPFVTRLENAMFTFLMIKFYRIPYLSYNQKAVLIRKGQITIFLTHTGTQLFVIENLNCVGASTGRRHGRGRANISAVVTMLSL